MLIEEVEKLRKLEAEATPAPWEVKDDQDQDGHSQPHISGICDFYVENAGWEDILFIEALRNAAPHLLAVAGRFRQYDSERLGFVLSGEFREHDCDCEQCRDATDMLRRLAEAARLMEG